MTYWTPEQQAIIDRINSGQEDFTFGPGSPNPTAEDLQTFVGGKYSPAGGFAVHGGVALAPAEYNLFTPDQRRQLGIMDIAPADQAGKIERYYAAGQGSNWASNMQRGLGMPTSGGMTVYNQLGYDPSQPQGESTASTGLSTGQKAGLAAVQSMLDSMAKQQQQGNQAVQSFMNRPRPGAGALAQLANNPLIYLRNPYLT